MFSLDREQSLKVDHWIKTVIYPQVLARQEQCESIRDLIFTDSKGVRHPYLGAIGGGVTYSFCPTSLGTITKVNWNDGTLNETLDVTDYDSW